MNQQLFAFWTHAIDKFASSIETFAELEETEESSVPDCVIQQTGATDEIEYLEMARAGFHLAIQSLPEDVRVPVEQYLAKRLVLTMSRVPEDLVDSDVLLGTNPIEQHERM